MKNKKNHYPIYSFVKDSHLFSCKIQVLFGLKQAIQDESVEAVPAAGDKDPAQMRQAHGTKTDPPGITAKPGKLR
jgi:hypothetical protein